jgi:predicted RNA polymerase sigma factor
MTARQRRLPAGPVSFDAVYACERSRLVRYLMAMGAGYHQADDAVQAAFTLAWDRWDTIRQPAPGCTRSPSASPTAPARRARSLASCGTHSYPS